VVDQVSIISSDKNNKNKTIIIKSVLADGAFDTNRNFQYLEEKRIKPGIKVRKNSMFHPPEITG
jgi:hypothetical protein